MQGYAARLDTCWKDIRTKDTREMAMATQLHSVSPSSLLLLPISSLLLICNFFMSPSLPPLFFFFFYPNLFSTDLWGFCFLRSSLCDSADVQYLRQRVIKRCDNRQNKSIGAWEQRQEQPHRNIWLQFTTAALPRYKRSLLLRHLNLNLLKLQLWY